MKSIYICSIQISVKEQPSRGHSDQWEVVLRQVFITYCLFVCLFVCLFGFNVAFNIICHITMVSGCDRELNAYFYSAASLWYQIPDTFT